MEKRTGYLSGYISSSALNVCVYKGVKHLTEAVHHILLLVANDFALFFNEVS